MAEVKNPYPDYQQDNLLFQQLLKLRYPLDPWAREVEENLAPRRPRWLLQAVQTYETQYTYNHNFNDNIFDSTAVLALRSATGGFLSNATSPAMPWVALGVRDKEIAKKPIVKACLDYVNDRILTCFDQSNFYGEMAMFFYDLLCMPAAVTLIEKDPKFKVRYNTLPWGSYVLGVDENGDVNQIGREEEYTVRQLIPLFCKMNDDGNYDLSNISVPIQGFWKSGTNENLDRRVVVRHLIRPNPKYDPNQPQDIYKKWISRYFEKLWGEHQGKFLRESGFDEFPAFVARWSKRSQEVYANDCPALQVLGDIKQLYANREDLNHGTDLVLDPPLVGPEAFNEELIQKGPGGFTPDNAQNKEAGLRELFPIPHDLTWVSKNIEVLKDIINRGFFVDLFLAISRLREQGENAKITATEVDALKNEKFQEVGSVVQTVFRSLRQCIDVTFAYLNEAGEFPPFPPEIAGKELPPEFLSPFARSQKTALLSLTDKLLEYFERMHAMDPTVVLNANFRAILENISMVLNLPSDYLNDQDEVNKQKAQMQQQQAAQQQAETANTASGTAKNMAQSPTDNGGLLQKLLELSGQGQPAAAGA